MNFLLRLGAWITDHPKLFCVCVFLAGGLLGVLAGRRLCATPSLKEEVKASEAAFGREVLTEKKTEGPWTRETWEYALGGSDGNSLGHDDVAVPRRTVCLLPGVAAKEGAAGPAAPAAPLILHSIERHEATATETHAESSTAQTSTQSLKLSQEASPAAQWALGAGLEDLLHEKRLRLTARRRLFGPFWLEAGVTPASKAVGIGAAVEF